MKAPAVRFIDRSFSGHCGHTRTCASLVSAHSGEGGLGSNSRGNNGEAGGELMVLHRAIAENPTEAIRSRFFEAYKNDPGMRNVNVVMCFHPSAMCELFLRFQKYKDPVSGELVFKQLRLFVIATTRFEVMRYDTASWRLWVERLRQIAADSHGRNIVAANNEYDRRYVEYFTGIRNVLLLASHVTAPQENGRTVYYSPLH